MPYVPLGLGMVKLLYVPMLIMLIQHNKELFSYFIFFRKERNILYIVIAFVLIRTVLGGDKSMISVHLVGFLEIFMVPLFIVVYSFRLGLDSNEKFVKSLLVVGAIGASISFVTIVFPSLQDFINSTFGVLDKDSFLMRNRWRGRGLSEALTSDYAYIQATLVIIFCYYFRHNKWFLFVVPFMLLSIIYNARTGIIILGLGALLFILSKRSFGKTFFFILGGFLIYQLFSGIFGMIGNTEDVTAFVEDFVQQMTALYENKDVEDSRTANELLVESFILPDGLEEWIIGKGYRLFGMKDILGISSDTGIINYLSYGGLSYVALLVVFYFVIIKRLLKMHYDWFGVYFLLIIIVITIKSIPFPNTGETRFLMLVYYYFTISYIKANSLNRLSPHTYPNRK